MRCHGFGSGRTDVRGSGLYLGGGVAGPGPGSGVMGTVLFRGGERHDGWFGKVGEEGLGLVWGT